VKKYFLNITKVNAISQFLYYSNANDIVLHYVNELNCHKF